MSKSKLVVWMNSWQGVLSLAVLMLVIGAIIAWRVDLGRATLYFVLAAGFSYRAWAARRKTHGVRH